MKLNFKSLYLYIFIGLCLSYTHISARSLTHKEQKLASSMNELSRLNNEYLSKINASVKLEELPLAKYFSLLILKNGCAPFKQTLEEIEMADENFPDQSPGLNEKLGLCKRSTNGLKEFDVFATADTDNVSEVLDLTSSQE